MVDRSTKTKMDTMAILLRQLWSRETERQAQHDESDLQNICYNIAKSFEPGERRVHDRHPIDGLPCGCWVCHVQREVERIYSSLESYRDSLNNGSRSANHEYHEKLLDRLRKINNGLDLGLRRLNVKRIAERCDLDLEMVLGPVEENHCSVCADERARQINVFFLVDGWSLRQVERWTEDTGERIPKSTLSDHARHLRTSVRTPVSRNDAPSRATA